jgi:SRSO17 transposase
MFNIIAENPKMLKKFIRKFCHIFSKRTYISFRIYFAGLFLELKRTNIHSIYLKSNYNSYENLQYFLSESKWSCEKLNDKRIKLLQSNKITKSKKEGVLAIDDTSCRKWGIKTQGAKIQYSTTEEKTINCNIVVVSAYCDKFVRYPINLLAYLPSEEFILGKEDPDFKSKIELAKELVMDAERKNIKFSDIVFDNWYFCNHFIEFIRERNKRFITESGGDRLISYQRKWIRVDELVKLIPSTKFKKVTHLASDGEIKSFYVYSFITKMKGIAGNVKVAVVKGKWTETDTKKVHVLVTNHLVLDGSEILEKYLLRWGIECIFRDLKENVAFDHYQVRSIKSITRHWHLSALAYTFLLWNKISLTSINIQTLGDSLNVYRKINTISCIRWVNKNKRKFQKKFGITKELLLAA